MENRNRVLRIKSGIDWEVDENEKVSFLNLSSISTFFNNSQLDQVEYYCDGSISALIIKIIGRRDIKRFSFDFTSMASPVFRNAEEKGIPLNILGATKNEIESFAAKISNSYPDLKFGVVRDGYFSPEESTIILKSIVDVGGVTILGLGAGKQEEVLLQLTEQGFQGACYTCGGFIRQESTSFGDYYPRIFDRLNIRFIYRMYKEPHTIQRYLIDYPKNILKLAYLVLSKKLKVYIN